MTMAEHVVVTKHDPEGRILEFVKTPIGLAAAESLKAQAFVVSERKRERELVRETAALIDKARLPAKTATPLLAPPASPAPRQLAPQSRVARGIQNPEQPPPAARRSPPATRAAKKLTPNELLAKIEEATVVMAFMKALAERHGAEVGKSTIAASLKEHENCVAGTRAVANSDSLDSIVRQVLDQFQKQNYLAIKTPESRAAFVKAFRAGADAAIAEFNQRKAVRPEKAGCP